MEKELALAMDFKKAPKELQDAATKHYDSLKVLTKAMKQKLDSELHLGLAQQLADESGKIFRAELKKWTPEV